MSRQKTILSRFIHALAFELIALVLCVPVLSMAFDVSLAHAGTLTVMVALLAMAWNMIYNMIFDKLALRFKWIRSLMLRIAHAALFEFGLLLIAVPVASWWLAVSLLDALLLDLGLVLFFLPYTFIYNWAYDQMFNRAHESIRV